VTRDQSGRVEPEAWECRTAIMALLVRIETDELAIAKDKPVDLSILHAPDDVFTDAATTVDVELFVKIDAHAAGCDLHDQFGSPFNVVIFRDAGLAAALGINHQQCIG